MNEEEKSNLVIDDDGWVVNGDPERGPTPRSGIKAPQFSRRPTKTPKQRKLEIKRTKKWNNMLKKWYNQRRKAIALLHLLR